MRRHGSIGWTMMAAVLGCALAAQAGNYYVRIGGSDSNSGADWANAYATIQKPLTLVNTNGDADATIYVGQTDPGSSYAASSVTFTNTVTARILGGYDTNTGVRTGMSRVETTSSPGFVFNLNATVPADLLYTGTFVVAQMDIASSASSGIACPEGTAIKAGTNRLHFLVVSNCTMDCYSYGIYMGIDSGDSGWASRQPNKLTHGLDIYSCVITSQCDRAVHINYGNGTRPVTIRNATFFGSSTATNSTLVSLQCNTLQMWNSMVTNLGSGTAVDAGRSLFNVTEQEHRHVIHGCAIFSAGNGMQLDSAAMSHTNGVSVTPVTIADTSIVTTGANCSAFITPSGLATFRRDTVDGNLPDLVLTNSTFKATGDGGQAVNIRKTNTTSADRLSAQDILVVDCTLQGRALAFYKAGHEDTGYYGQDSYIHLLRSTFAAGAADGGANGTGVVVNVWGRCYDTLEVDRCVVKNGAAGILFNGMALKSGTLKLINSVITDMTNSEPGITNYGVKVDADYYTSASEIVIASNCTFSCLAGPPIVLGDNQGSGGTLSARLYNTALAPGALGGNAAATNFVNEDAQAMTLSGRCNAFYTYGTFSNGLVNVSLTNSLDVPGGDAGLASDGYHLQVGSPLRDKYTLRADDPTVDIDGDTRPIRTMADIGADEATAPAGTIIQVH